MNVPIQNLIKLGRQVNMGDRMSHMNFDDDRSKGTPAVEDFSIR